MKAYLKTELYKTFRNRFFYISLGLGLVLAAFSAASMWGFYRDSVAATLAYLESSGRAAKDNFLSGQTLFNSWVGADKQGSGAAVFYLLAPILSALPCAWHFCEEVHSGYLHMIVARGSRRAYFQAKLLVSFLAGGTALALPQLVSFFIMSLCIPAVKQSALFDIYSAVMHGDLLSSVYYTHPFIYVALIIGLNFLFGGLFAWMALTTALFSESRLAALIGPFLLLMLAHSCGIILVVIFYAETSPFHILHPMAAPGSVTAGVVFIWILLLTAATLPVVMIRGCRRDIF